MKQRLAVLVLALLALLALGLAAGCGGDDEESGEAQEAQQTATSATEEEQELSQETIRVFVGIDTAYAPFFVAEREGLFEEEGINVELTQFTQGGEGVDALTAGEMDAGGSGDATVLGKSTRSDIRALAVLQESGDYIKLVVREDIDEPSQIEKVGIVPGSLSEYGAVRMLEHFDISEDSVEFVPAGPPELPPLLQRGDVDAFVIWEPWPTQAEELGGKVLMRTKEFDYSYLFFLIARGDWFDEHEAEAAAYVRALARAAEMVEEDPDLAAEATEAEVRIPPDQSLTAVEQIDFDVRPFSDEDIENLDRVADFLVDREIVETKPDPEALVVEGFAEEALASN
jgi:NitT/TauT family transport system substrate-binding protein